MSENQTPRSPSRIIWLCIGFIAGATVGGIISLIAFQFREHQLQVQFRQIAGKGVNLELLDPLVKKIVPEGGKPGETDETAILTLGKGFVEDLRDKRLASVWRSMSSNYQRKNLRNDFDEKILKNTELQRLELSQFANFKARKGENNKDWEFYFTGRDPLNLKILANIALIFQQENGVWKVEEMEIDTERKGS